MKKRIAIYARVSTFDKEQNPENQFIKAKEFCKNRDWVIYKQYQDFASGSNPNRPGLQEMMKDARWKKFDSILIVRLDRITRSLINLLELLRNLDEMEISLICIDQPIETDSSSGKLLIHIIGAVAEYERELIRERVKDGMHRARKEGIKIGRPLKRTKKKTNEIMKLWDEGYNISEIARTVGLSRQSVTRCIAQKGGFKNRS